MSDILAAKHLPQISRLPVPGTALTTVLLAVVVVVALYFGREVLVPIALAVLMSFVLAPPVRRLQAWYVPRILAVILVVLLAFAAIFSLGGLMVSQVNQLATDLPQYQSTLREKIESLRGAAAVTGTLERASDVLQDLSKELDKPKGQRDAADATRNRWIIFGQTYSSRGEAAGPGRSTNACVAHLAPYSSACNDWYCDHLRYFHSPSETGFAEQAGSTGGFRGPSENDRRNG